MIDRPTPETDDIARGNHVVPTEWAQQLERERDEARRKLNNLDVTAIHSCHNECQRPVCILRRERDEAQEALDKEMKFHHRTHAELVQTQCQMQDVIRERDEAREVLKRIAHASMSVRHKEEDYAEWEKAVESLQGICEEKNFINE